MQNKRRRAIRKGWKKGREIPAYATPYFEKGKTSHAPKTQLRTVIWLFCFSLSGGLQFKRAGAQKLLIVVINRPGAVTEIFTNYRALWKLHVLTFGRNAARHASIFVRCRPIPSAIISRSWADLAKSLGKFSDWPQVKLLAGVMKWAKPKTIEQSSSVLQ